MSLPPSHHAFLQRATPEGCEERGFLDGRANDIRTRRIEAPYAHKDRGKLEVVRGGVGWLLSAAAKLIYVAPVLIAVKLILYFIDNTASDFVVVAFVGFVVFFFVLLNVYIFISIIWWLFGRSPMPFTLVRPFDEDGREALELLPGGGADVGDDMPAVGRLVRARGSIVRLGPNREGDGTVLRDLWTEDDARLRFTEAADFAVVSRGRLPVVVRFGSAPAVIAKPEPMGLEAFAFTAGEGTMSLLQEGLLYAAVRGSVLTLHEGDEVEVTGVVAGHIDNVDGFDIGGTYASVPLPDEPRDGASPFRDRPGGPGILLGEGPGTSILIRRRAAVA